MSGTQSPLSSALFEHYLHQRTNLLLPTYIALFKQTSPHWIAYFFNTDLTDYDTELQRILRETGDNTKRNGPDGSPSNCADINGHGDDRLRYVHIPVDKRPQVQW